MRKFPREKRIRLHTLPGMTIRLAYVNQHKQDCEIEVPSLFLHFPSTATATYVISLPTQAQERSAQKGHQRFEQLRDRSLSQQDPNQKDACERHSHRPKHPKLVPTSREIVAHREHPGSHRERHKHRRQRREPPHAARLIVRDLALLHRRALSVHDNHVPDLLVQDGDALEQPPPAPRFVVGCRRRRGAVHPELAADVVEVLLQAPADELLVGHFLEVVAPPLAAVELERARHLLVPQRNVAPLDRADRQLPQREDDAVAELRRRGGFGGCIVRKTGVEVFEAQADGHQGGFVGGNSGCCPPAAGVVGKRIHADAWCSWQSLLVMLDSEIRIALNPFEFLLKNKLGVDTTFVGSAER